MLSVTHCPVCGTETDNTLEQMGDPLSIDCGECGKKIYMEVWTYE